MNNPAKIIFGSIVGSGIGVAISRYLESQTIAADGVAVTTEDGRGIVETMKARWAQARIDGEVARQAKEAELRAYFRDKVDDPSAMRDNPTI